MPVIPGIYRDKRPLVFYLCKIRDIIAMNDNLSFASIPTTNYYLLNFFVNPTGTYGASIGKAWFGSICGVIKSSSCIKSVS